MIETRALCMIHQLALWLARPWMRRLSGPLYMTIVVVDIQSFGDPARRQQHREAMVLGLRTALEEALRKTLKEVGKRLSACNFEPQGDGALVLVPGRIPSSVILTYLPNNLSRELRRYNATRCLEAQIKLRVAVHVGPVPTMVSSDPVIHANRLVEAEPLKSALEDSRNVLGVIASDKLYQEIIRHDPACNYESYVEVPVKVKETEAKAWIYMPS